MTALKAQFLSRCFLLLLLSAGHGLAAQTAWPAPNQFGDYDSELRGPDKRVDTERLAKRLSELGVNTYYWLIWHRSTDWDDLKLFLPSAAKARIAVWAYLVPPTEGPPGGYPASERSGWITRSGRKKSGDSPWRTRT